MSAVSLPSYEVRTGARLWRRLLVIAAVGQAVSSIVVSTFGGAFTTADRANEPLIVPPGGTFAIWSVIIALSVGYAVWAESDRRPDPELRDRLTRPLLVTTVGFSVWLAAAELEPNWTTLVVFVVMLAGLLRALAYAMEQRAAIRAWSPLARGLLWGTLGLYTGWSSVAIWLNLCTALVGSGAPVTTPSGRPRTDRDPGRCGRHGGRHHLVHRRPAALRRHHRLGLGRGHGQHGAGGLSGPYRSGRGRPGHRAHHRGGGPAASREALTSRVGAGCPGVPVMSVTDPGPPCALRLAFR